MDCRLEVVPPPVRGVEAARASSVDRVGLHLDHDAPVVAGIRVVQMTPVGSACSVVAGTGLPVGEPGSVQGVQPAGRGVPMSEVRQRGPEGTPGPRSAFCSDPDGDGWSVQEIRRR